jgi:hypothetical protein
LYNILITKKFNNINELNIDRIRKKIYSALIIEPAEDQHSDSSIKNVKEPAIAIMKMITSAVNGKTRVGLVHDGDCFISYPYWFKNDEKGFKIRMYDKNIIKELSEGDQKKLKLAKEDILNLKKKMRKKF